jgi:WXG100 family type VII secretion target
MPDVSTSHIKVPTTLEEAGPFMQGNAATIVGELTALQGKLAPLAGTWSGETSRYYQEHQQMWNVASDGLFGPEGVLGLIAQALNTNWNNYSEAEISNTNTWKH